MGDEELQPRGLAAKGAHETRIHDQVFVSSECRALFQPVSIVFGVSVRMVGLAELPGLPRTIRRVTLCPGVSQRSLHPLQGPESGRTGELPGSSRSRLGVSGGSRRILGFPALSGHGRSFAQALERCLLFFRPGVAHLEDQLAATPDQAARVYQKDGPGPLPPGPGQVLAQHPRCRQRMEVERQDDAHPPGRVGTKPAAWHSAAHETVLPSRFALGIGKRSKRIGMRQPTQRRSAAARASLTTSG